MDPKINTVNPATARPPQKDQRFSFAVLILLTCGALYVAYIIFRPFLTSLFLAFVLMIAFLPLHQWIARRVHGANLAALVTTAVVVLLILVPLIWLSYKLVTEATSFYAFMSQNQWGAAYWSGHVNWLTDVFHRLAERTGMPPGQLRSMLIARAQGFGAWLVGVFSWAAKNLAQQIGTAIVTLFVLFFFLRDREKYGRTIESSLPLPAGRVVQLSAAMHKTVVANIYGMFTVGIIQGALTAIGFWMCGLRAPLLWGAIATILSFVPLIGPSLVWWPGVFVLGLQGHWVKAIILVVWGLVVITSADYLIRPRVTGGRVNANTLLILLSFLGGLKAFGAIGIIAGPVVLSLVTALLSMVREEHARLSETSKLAA
ncbi:MAG TPA: AI-2E family transporter [Candidatus Angelobacter sp.]|nr:AI-2E family transporter [Candidatus Angelobacter sp.]